MSLIIELYGCISNGHFAVLHVGGGDTANGVNLSASNCGIKKRFVKTRTLAAKAMLYYGLSQEKFSKKPTFWNAPSVFKKRNFFLDLFSCKKPLLSYILISANSLGQHIRSFHPNNLH